MGKRTQLVSEVDAEQGQRVHVDDSFDLLSRGHLEFCGPFGRRRQRRVKISTLLREYTMTGRANGWKELNHPIMSIFERARCVLQCRFAVSKNGDIGTGVANFGGIVG